MNEFEFIQNLKKRTFDIGNRQTASRRIGIGDDCAVLPKDSETDLVMTTDLLVEDIDFRIEWTKPEFLGHKALAVSLSDVASMGAKPVWAMLSIGVPEAIWKTDFVEKFYDGWFLLAKKYGVELIGGDVSRTPDKIVIDSIAAGEIEIGKAVLRSTAKPNDLIFVTGELGGAAAALSLLEDGERYDKSNFKKLLRRQLAPNPQTEIGEFIGAKNLATAMIDLSDGLSSDLAHLCRASKVGAKIFADKIPIDKRLKKFPARRHAEAEKKLDGNLSPSPRLPVSLSHLYGGEDFELLFTINPEKKVFLENEPENYRFSCIGEINSNAEIIELIADGKSSILQPKGFRHF